MIQSHLAFILNKWQCQGLGISQKLKWFQSKTNMEAACSHQLAAPMYFVLKNKIQENTGRSHGWKDRISMACTICSTSWRWAGSKVLFLVSNRPRASYCYYLTLLLFVINGNYLIHSLTFCCHGDAVPYQSLINIGRWFFLGQLSHWFLLNIPSLFLKIQTI